MKTKKNITRCLASQKCLATIYNFVATFIIAILILITNSCTREWDNPYDESGNNKGKAPIAAFTANVTTIAEGEMVTFTNQSTNTPTSWSWNFGDGGSTSAKNPAHIYITQGTYTVTLTVTNSYGNDTETKADYITVIASGNEIVIDYDGNTYNTVIIGSQIWMVQNLKTTHYPNGTAIPLVTDNAAWFNLGDNNTDDAFCYYDNLNENRDTYAALYTYAAAKNACPIGWHLPADAEWKTLEMHLGMSQSDADNTGWRGTDEGKKLKATGGWNDNGNGTDDYGFSAFPGGYRGDYGGFDYVGRYGYWWSATESNSNFAYYRSLHYDSSKVNRNYDNKSYGFSVRCVKGETTGSAPEAAFTSDKNEITEGEMVTFTDQSTNTPTSWSWNFGDGGSSTDQSPAHTYITQGTYTVALIATNSFGNDTETKTDYITVIAGGNEIVTDYDSNDYNTVTIGSQIWMAQNLKTTHYPNGAEIPLVTDTTAWGSLGNNDTDDAYCYYDNSNENRDTYGALYTYAAAKNVCPTGWHLPTDDEWKTLEIYLGMSQSDADDTGWRGTDEGNKLKATSGWNSNGNGTNDYGFSAFPGGYRFIDGNFYDIGNDGGWWSATEYNSSSGDAYSRKLHSYDSKVNRESSNKSWGFSVRCLRDSE